MALSCSLVRIPWEIEIQQDYEKKDMGLHALPLMVCIPWNTIIGAKYADGKIIEILAMDYVSHIPYS